MQKRVYFIVFFIVTKVNHITCNFKHVCIIYWKLSAPRTKPNISCNKTEHHRHLHVGRATIAIHVGRVCTEEIDTKKGNFYCLIWIIFSLITAF